MYDYDMCICKKTIAANLLAISLFLTGVECSDGWFSKHS
jgi:hypothetical protein